MQEDIQEEVVHCPNCREEVPKTLYCLNCGHPLYKETSTIEETPKQEVGLEEHLAPAEIHLKPEAEGVGAFEPILEEPMEETKLDEIIVQNSPTELNQMNLQEHTEREEEHTPPIEGAAHEISLDEDKSLGQEPYIEAAQDEV